MPLLDARIELTRHLTADERAELQGVSLPVIMIEPGPLSLDAMLAGYRAFGATVLEGMVTGSLRIGEHAGIHLLGPGDLLVSSSELSPAWLGDSELRASSRVRIGLLGNDLLAAAYRWPRVVQGLYASVGEQLQRLTAQLVICQLPRVEDRVIAMLWLLAESWGHVTPSGVRVPLSLTHESVGALVGARRPTVTLALRKLTEEGALIAQDSGWLLIGPPPAAVASDAKIIPVEVVPPRSRWARPASSAAPTSDLTVTYAELRETVSRLRHQHSVAVEHTRDRLTRVRRDRLRMSTLRDRIAADALKRRPPPSS